MKGKLAFVLGAALGYVLGARAGRERYEQIKRRVDAIWNTEPVQRSVSVVREVVDDRVDELKDLAKRVGADVVNNIAQKAGGGSRTSDPAASSGSSAKGKSKATGKSETTPKPEASPAAAASSDTAAIDQKSDTKKPESSS